MLLRNALIAEAVSGKWADLDVEQVPEDGSDVPLPTGDRALRGQVRLLLRAVVESKLSDRLMVDYRADLGRVPWANSCVRASRAVNRLLEISDWAEPEYGEESASSWGQAARLAEWLVEDYSGWPHLNESYADLAAWYFGALRGGGWNETVFLNLLADLAEG